MVFERVAVGAELEHRREVLRRDTRGLMTHQVLAREVRQARPRRLCLPPPALERGCAVHVLRDALLVERVDQVGVDQDVRAPRLVLQALDLGDQAPVVRENGARVSKSPSTSAERMKMSRARSGSCGANDTPVRIDRKP